ncbi:putative pre-rRNA-processing protein TSR2 [Medicago truncatula]|nr:pre-rRNA-processing protein TSR2 [Medicago truncatula]RHN78187.1 putative pre-rRNA-processing protein TSR2 [Medicago truncatula]
MACPNGGEWIQVFKEGIGLVLGRWSALQHAIEQGWCKGNSRLEAQNLASNILSWFTHSKNLDVYDLETLLDKAMDFFKLVHQEGSVEEVAKLLMKMYEECLVGNFMSVERLREASRNQVAHPPVGKVVNADGDDDDSDSDDEDSGSGNKDNNSGCGQFKIRIQHEFHEQAG